VSQRGTVPVMHEGHGVSTGSAAETRESAVRTKTHPRPRPRRRRSGRNLLGLVARYLAMAFAVLAVATPLLWQLSTALKGRTEAVVGFPPTFLPMHPTFDNFLRVFTDVPMARYFANSAAIAAMGVVTNCVLATTAGYALARMTFRGRNAYFAALLATVVLPFEVILVSVFLIVRQVGLYDTLLGVVAPHAVTVFGIFVMRQAFIVVPRELDEAAWMDGANEWQLFRHICLPAVRGSLAVIAVFSFIDQWDQFLWPLIALRSPDNYPVTVGLQFLSGTFSADQRVIAAGTILALAPPMLVFLFMQRFFFRGIGEGSLKG
jgi:putative chitobiose transport system permease protein